MIKEYKVQRIDSDYITTSRFYRHPDFPEATIGGISELDAYKTVNRWNRKYGKTHTYWIEEDTKDYLVRWQIEVDATSPKDAARKALEIQRDTDSIATVFDVVRNGIQVTIDLKHETSLAQAVMTGKNSSRN